MNIQFKDEQIIDGIRFYIKDDDSLVIADQWDKMFKPEKLPNFALLWLPS